MAPTNTKTSDAASPNAASAGTTAKMNTIPVQSNFNPMLITTLHLKAYTNLVI